MQLPELGSVNFKICTKITGDSFPQRKTFSTLSQKELFPADFQHLLLPVCLFLPPSVLLFPTSAWISSIPSSCSCDRERMHQSSLLILPSRDVTSPAAEQSWFPAAFTFPNTVHCGSVQLSVCMNWYCWPVSNGCWLLCPQTSRIGSSSPDLEQNLSETSVQLKLRRERAVWCCSPTMGCVRWGIRNCPCSHRGLAACVKVDWCCQSSSSLLSLALGGCHHGTKHHVSVQ